MQLKGKYYLSLALLCVLHGVAYSQTADLDMPDNEASMSSWQKMLKGNDTIIPTKSFFISAIVIAGDHKTKSYIIERELPFKAGDSVVLKELVEKFEIARHQLMNTRLFNEVIVSLKSFKGYLVEVEVEVKERWYIFPIPYFRPVDRNLSAWADKGYNINRINYGLKFSYYNFTGRNDKLKAWFISGYSRQVEFSYEQPYADKTLKHGYGVSVSYSGSKEINAGTNSNEQVFLKADSISYAGKFLNQVFNLSFSYSYRPALRTRHVFRVAFVNNRIDSAVTVVNPHYFSNGKMELFYPELSYSVEYNNIDYVAYPLKGFIGDANLTRKGFNGAMNLWQLNARGTLGVQTSGKTYYGLQAYGVLKLPFNQPYLNQRLFGYGDLYLRGLEKYVIDGVAAAMVRNTWRCQVLSFNVPFTRSQSHDRIPFKVFVKAYGDMGYAYNKNFKQNSLVNQMLYTAGAGIDIVSFYDLVFRFEYSFNQLGQNGLFLHVKNDF